MLWLERVHENGIELLNVPEAEKTATLCRIAVGQTGWALEYVPEDLKTPELCRAAYSLYRRAGVISENFFFRIPAY